MKCVKMMAKSNDNINEKCVMCEPIIVVIMKIMKIIIVIIIMCNNNQYSII